MRPTLALLTLALLLVPQPAAASEPIWQPGTVWTVYNTVTADVRDNYATVKVIADIGNRGPDPEFPFVVRIPDDAFVTGLTIERDGTVYEAEIKDRAAARQEYEEWKAQQQTGGLVEKARHTSVYSYLVNVAEFTSVRATLTYERYLAADRGVYNLSLEAPVSGFGEDLGARFEVTVRDATGVVGLWGDPSGRTNGNTLTYEVGPRPDTEHPTPFTASYMLGATGEGGSLLTTVVDGVGYFAHRFRAEDDARQLPMDLVLVLDVSGSMSGLKMRQMIDAAKQVVGTLDENDRLHLVAFSSDSHSTWSGLIEMTPDGRRRAVDEIEALFDGGGTNIESGLRRGFTALDPQRDCVASGSSAGACGGIDWTRAEERFPALVLLTDGQPTAGVTSHEGLRRIARDANDHAVPVFGIAFGDDADWKLIRALAADGEGAAIRVPLGAGAEVDLRRFMSALTTPVLRDVSIAYNDGVTAYRSGAPVLFAGSEMLVIGTYDPARGISGAITGWSLEGERRYEFSGGEDASLSFLPRLVAYHRVRAMQEEASPDVAAIKELALRYSFVTDHTSLVLTLPERDVRAAPPPGTTTMNSEAQASSAPGSNASGGLAYSVDDSYGGGDPSSARIAQRAYSTPPPTALMLDQDGDGTGAAAEHNAPVAQTPGPAIPLVLLALAAIALLGKGRATKR